jgi:hypothetical protein
MIVLWGTASTIANGPPGAQSLPVIAARTCFGILHWLTVYLIITALVTRPVLE